MTVGSLGSCCCVLDTVSEQPWLELTADHTIGSNTLEKRRLAAAGCLVAAVDRSGSGPARTPYSGAGVLRLWPGEAAVIVEEECGSRAWGSGVGLTVAGRVVGGRLSMCLPACVGEHVGGSGLLAWQWWHLQGLSLASQHETALSEQQQQQLGRAKPRRDFLAAAHTHTPLLQVATLHLLQPAPCNLPPSWPPLSLWPLLTPRSDRRPSIALLQVG